MTVSNQIKISALYAAVFKRAPDKAGLDFWSVQATANPATVFNTIAAGFSQHPVFSEVYDSLTGSAYVNALYTNILGSAGDAAGVAFWTKQITDGRTKSEVLASFVQSSLETDLTKLSLTPAELAAAQIRQQTITNKATVGVQFATLLGSSSNLASTTNPSTLAGLQADPAYLASVAVIANVTHVASTASNAIANISVAAASGNPIAYLGGAGSAPVTGQTFTLTANIDALSGTAGNDTFNGVLQTKGGAGTTIAPGDSINGGAGTDTLFISVAGDNDDYTLSAVQTESVERVLLNNFDTANNKVVTVATDLMNGLTTVGLQASAAEGDTAFSGMRALVGAEMRNGAGDLTLSYAAAAVAGSADTQALTVSNLSAGKFTANSTETIAITSQLVKSTLTGVVSNALKTVVITGDKDLKITDALDFVSNGTKDAPGAVVDASKFTGKLEIKTTNGEILDIKGGSGDDFITLGGLSKDDKINGGEGNNTVSLAVGAVGDKFAQVTNIQNAVFTGAFSNATQTLDASKMGSVKNVVVDVSDGTDAGGRATAAVTGLGVGQAVTVQRSTADLTDFDANDGVNLTISSLVDTASDSLNLTLSGIDTNANKKGLGVLNVAPFEVVNIASNTNSGGTIKTNQIEAATATETKTINITGNAALTLGEVTGSKVTSIDASAMTGKLTLTLAAMDATVKLAATDSILTLADGSLNNKDTVIGGAGKDKLVVGAVTGLTATTGKLNISGVEAIELATTGANTLDLTNVVGATTFAVSANTQTITGLNLNTEIVVTDAATLIVTAANATGTADVLKVASELSNNDKDVVVEAKDIETIQIRVKDTHPTEATPDVRGFNLTKFEGSTVTFSQDAASNTAAAVTVDLAGTKLHKNVTTVNATGLKGAFTANASDATAAVTMSVQGAGIQTLTGGSKGDTFNIASTGAIVHTINGGDGVDTTNIAVKQGWVDPSAIATEKVNITVNAGDSVTIAAGKAFNAATVDITLAGGNSLSTFSTLANANTVLADAVKTFDASNFAGKITVSVADDKLDETVAITGGALTTDSVTATLATAGTYKPKTVGVESLLITASNAATTAAAYTLDLSSSTGVKTVVATVGDADTLTVDKVTDQLIQVVSADATTAVATIEAKLVDATGASDSVSFELKDAATNLAAGTKLKTTDIETVNIKVSSAESISLADVSITAADKFASLVLTGDKALTISALNADVNVINASAMAEGGSVVQNARSGTSAATYTGSAGADTFIMNNAADAINGGAGTDTLDINFNAILGGIQVDLSSKTDQITSFNGSANAAVQVGFENVDLAGFTGTFGADITAAATGSKITGTANADIIRGGAGADVIIGGGGEDIITTGAGIDKVQLEAIAVAGSLRGADIITDFTAGTGGDIIVALDTDFAWDFGTSNGIVVLATGATAAAAAAANANATVMTVGNNVATHTVATFLAGTSTIAELEGAIATAMGTTLTTGFNGKHVLIAVDDGASTMLVRYSDAGTDGAVVGEISLIGILQGVSDATTLAAGNFNFA